MNKDKLGNYISKYSVVQRGSSLYTVEGFDMKRDFFVKLRNGCVVSYAKPEELICIDNISDLF